MADSRQNRRPDTPAAATERGREPGNATAVYFVLFALNLISLLLIGRVNLLLQDQYNDLADANVAWSGVNQRTAALSKAARKANEPANDVFNTLNRELEHEQLRTSLAHLFALLASEKNALALIPNLAQRQRLQGNLVAAEIHLLHMATTSENVFLYLSTTKKNLAGANMALTDRHYGAFLDEMAARDSIVDAIQAELFRKDDDYRTGLYKLVLFGIFIVIVLGTIVLVYGLQLAGRARRAMDNEKASQASLERSDAHLRKLNENLEHLLAAQQRFVADAAHQLRTPIAGISLQVELALKASTMEEVRTVLAQLRSGSNRIVRLSRQLLTMASADPKSGGNPQFEQIDLCAIAREVGLRWLGSAHAKNIDLELDPGEHGVPILGNAVLIGEIISNLIENAVHYSPAYSRITVAVRALPAPQLSIEDGGPGIAFAERERVFDRFHRIAGSAGDGAGLGLAIVRDIAHLHGAEVSLEDPASGRGLRVRVVFPPSEADKF